jgi:hypothetical protein
MQLQLKKTLSIKTLYKLFKIFSTLCLKNKEILKQLSNHLLR